MVYVQLKCVSRENFIFTFHLSNIFVSAALRQRYVKFIVTCAHIRRNGNFSTLLIFYFKRSENNKKINGGRFFSVAFGIPQYNRVVQWIFNASFLFLSAEWCYDISMLANSWYCFYYNTGQSTLCGWFACLFSHLERKYFTCTAHFPPANPAVC